MERIFFGLLLLMFVLSGCGGGGGNSGNSTSTGSSGDSVSNPLALSVVLGPIVDADVRVTLLNDHDVVLLTGKTQDDADLLKAAWVLWDQEQITTGHENEPLFVSVSGGFDIDADDDGLRDIEPTENNVELKFALPTPDDLTGLQIVANPLLQYASEYLLMNLDAGDNVTSEQVRTVLRRVSNSLISEDINGDGKIDWHDIAQFHPLVDQEKTRVPWEKVLGDIARKRQAYEAKMEVSYSYATRIERSTLLPEGWISDGSWQNSTASGFGLLFYTNKGSYNLCDLYQEQGRLGGSVILPKGASFSYDNPLLGVVENDTQPPLYIQITPNEERGHCRESIYDIVIGGHIVEPKVAPSGEYIFNYSTPDGLTHTESLYVYDNIDTTNYVAWPEVEVDQDGFLTAMKWVFENSDGSLVEDPPILFGTQYVELIFPTVNRVNGVSRSPEYYQTTLVGGYVFHSPINLIEPDAETTISNMGTKIYFEDVGTIKAWFHNGDGTMRMFSYDFDGEGLSPQRIEAYTADNQVIISYEAGSATDRDILSIRYRFNYGERINDDKSTEIIGSSMTVVIPEGAQGIWTAAKDSTGYYSTPELFEFNQ